MAATPEITAWHAPWAGKHNPYQQLLAGSLEPHGVRIVPMRATARFIRHMKGCKRGDVLHLHWLGELHTRGGFVLSLIKSLYFLGQLWRLKRRGIRLVYTVHNLEAHDPKHPRLQRWVKVRTARACDSLIAHCGYARRAAAERFGVPLSRISVIPHGNYIGAYPEGTSRAEKRDELGIPEDSFVFLFFGALRWYKGLDELIEAFGEVKSDRARLVIAGKPMDANVNRQVGEAVQHDPRIVYVPGFVEDVELSGFLRMSDMMVLAFKRVLTSGSMILSMSYGLPVLTRAAGCLSETGEGWGVYFYGEGQGKTLADTMQHAAEQPAELAEAGLMAEQRAKRWSWARVGKRTARVYGVDPPRQARGQ
ncbi:MAG: glycosyltransferase family 4 protein [Planctomycetota bacterium]